MPEFSQKTKRGGLVLTFIIFLVMGAISLDPDFGFRLRTGGLILREGFPKTDPYSYTMPSFPYVEHAPFTAVVWAKLFPIIGKKGLSAIYSALAVSAILIAYLRTEKLKGTELFQYSLFILAISVITPFVGIRAQIITWLFGATLLKVIFDESLWKRWRGYLPFFFVLWANLHGGFAAGLIILFFVVAVRSFRNKSVGKSEVLVLGASVMGTFVNPYGVGAWREVWQSLSDTQLRWQISEWMPVFLSVDLSFAAFVTLATVLILRYRKEFTPEETGLYFLMLFQAILTRRHVPLWVIVALPTASSGINFFYQEIKKIEGSALRFRKAVKFTLKGSLVILIFQLVFSLRSAILLSEDKFYPKKAVSYLSENLPEGEVFSEYGWGGYLIWKLPEKKVFIDGRMPSWRWDRNPQAESASAFDDYNSLLKGEIDYKKVFDKYGVDTVLWSPSMPKSVLEIWGEKIFTQKRKEDYDLIEALVQDGWEMVYEDSVAVVYRKQ